ncbi:MAG: type II secretion system F family protein [bacterium]
MPAFYYKVLDNTGKEVKGEIEGANARGVRESLRNSGFFIIELQTISEKKSYKDIGLKFISKGGFSFSKGRLKKIAVFTRQLQMLLKAGLPLVPALTAINDQAKDKELKKVIIQVQEKVKAGNSLANTLEGQGHLFDNFYVNMIRAGESSGSLETILERLGDYLENQINVINKVTAGLAYPLIMALVAIFVLSFLLIFVVPKITNFFSEINQALPLITVLLIKVTDFLKRFFFLIIICLSIIFIIFKRYIKTEKGRYYYDLFKLKIPLIGDINQKVIIARFSRTLSTLLKGGVSLVQSLDIIKNLVGNVVFLKAIDSINGKIKEGQTIAEQLDQYKSLFPPLVVHMVSIGEKSGYLEDMLLSIANAYDNEVDSTIDTLTALLEPIMILMMAIVVGFIYLAILLPILEMGKIR